MIPYLKNSVVGFAISFVGSIPLGYLNVIGLQYYEKGNIPPTLFFLLGVVLIESAVIYFTAKGVSKIALQPELKTKISLFSIIFLVLLAYLAKPTAAHEPAHQSFNLIQFIHYPFLTGMVLSSLNFAQVPFWLSWNVYMLNEKYITPQQNGLLWYTFGAVIGTFTGMLSLIIVLHKTVSYTQFSFQKYISFIFIGLAMWQIAVLIKNKIIRPEQA
ncbi:LysE family transporter [Flavobacterium sp. H122]|uniref:LysE family transporter n=1 Tax=Flavobacterium sp. H122 TaxID=2529860 RepID=UPI0010AB1836|nr:LysE family transporter [Flavobacterium sp. H122]